MEKKQVLHFILPLVALSLLASCQPAATSSAASATSASVPTSTATSSVIASSSSALTMTIKIATPAKTALYVGETLQLEAVITPASATAKIEWHSDDATVISVDANGLVSALKAGSAKIQASLAGTTIVSQVISFSALAPVAMESLTISDEITQHVVVGQSFTLHYTYAPSNASDDAVLTSSDSTIASVEGMAVTFLKAGEVTITAASKLTPSAKDSVTFSVLASSPFQAMNKGYSANMDFTHMLDLENPYLQVKGYTDASENPFNEAVSSISGTAFYLEATINISHYRGGERGWPMVGIGHADSASVYKTGRALFFSPMDGQKVVVMDIGKTYAAEAELADRYSLIYQANGLKDFAITSLKFSMVRNGDEFYYLLNDKLFGYEKKSYGEAVTYPVIVGKDCDYTIANWSASTDAAFLKEKLALSTYQETFLPGAENTTYDPTAKTITFACKDGDKWGASYANQTYVRSIGEKAVLTGNFTVEYDVTAIEATSNEIAKRLSLMLARVGTSPVGYECFGVNNWWWEDGNEVYGAEFKSWAEGSAAYESANVVNGRIGDDGVRDTPAVANEHVVGHYVVTRTIQDGKSVFTWKFTKAGTTTEENVFAFTNHESVSISFTGAYRVNFGAACIDGTIANWKWSQQ